MNNHRSWWERTTASINVTLALIFLAAMLSLSVLLVVLPWLLSI